MQNCQDSTENFKNQYNVPENIAVSFGGKRDLFVELANYRNLPYEQQSLADDLYKKTNDIKAVDDLCKDFLLKEQAQKLLSQSKINNRFLNATFENYRLISPATKNAKAKAMHFVENIEEHRGKGTNLIIEGCGCIGTGKTHLAYAVANKLMTAKGIPCKVIRADAMVRELKDTFCLQEFIDIEILTIDDLGKEIGTPWVTEQIDAIVNARWEAMKTTVITTENSIKELKANYGAKGKAIISRLTQDFILITLTGDDYRQARK